jgi:hypothetical protein
MASVRGAARVEYRSVMHVRRGFLGWGVFLILTGAVPLAIRAGYLTTDQVGRLWTLWPLILIGVGVGLILRRTRFDFLGGLIVAATLGLMAGGLLSGRLGTLSNGACGQEAGSVAFPPREGTLSAGGAVDLLFDCANVTVDVGPGNLWRVEGKDEQGSGPDIDATTSMPGQPPSTSGRRRRSRTSMSGSMPGRSG